MFTAEQRKTYYATHKEEILEKQRKRRERNPEAYSAYRKKYRLEHRVSEEQRRIWNKKYYKRQKEQRGIIPFQKESNKDSKVYGS